ncbi:sarcosine oxidase subunit gamma [Rhodobacteraceae bacterium M385]|nr:sarcosine oxidase subunit gamma [Rhodobacteraceae bacterium M385]
MSNSVSALQGAAHTGFAHIREMGLLGMVTLRADLSAPKTAAAVKAAVGLDLPTQRAINTGRDPVSVAWMAPDEVLIMCKHEDADKVVASLAKDMGGAHHLAVNVSDARAVFTVEAAEVREVLGKLTPADLGILKYGEMRRSRLAQVPAAFWMNDQTHASVICFRSVAQYAFDLLSNASAEGSEVGYY